MTTYKPTAVRFRRPPSPAQALVELEPGDVDALRAGRVAWRRLRDAGSTSFEEHMLVARALKAIRRMAEKRLSSRTGRKDSRNNGAFNTVMARLLEAHDLADTSTTYRWGALWCLENEAECRRVLDALPEGERAFHNFPPHVRGLVISARAPPPARREHRSPLAGRQTGIRRRIPPAAFPARQ
jgi:hypothetical protein